MHQPCDWIVLHFATFVYSFASVWLSPCISLLIDMSHLYILCWIQEPASFRCIVNAWCKRHWPMSTWGIHDCGCHHKSHVTQFPVAVPIEWHSNSTTTGNWVSLEFECALEDGRKCSLSAHLKKPLMVRSFLAGSGHPLTVGWGRGGTLKVGLNPICGCLSMWQSI